jgi:hypothetical protein
MWRKQCPVCAERTLLPFVALVFPRCKNCKSRFRVRLPYGLGFAGHYVSRTVLFAAVAAALVTQGSQVFAMGLLAFAALESVIFFWGRLEPDRRDPITVMQQRRYERPAAKQ